MRVGADGAQTVIAQPIEQTRHIVCAHERHIEQRSHAAAHHLRIERIDARLDQHHRRSAHRVGGADQRAQVAGVLQAVKHQHQRLRAQPQLVQAGPEQIEGRDEALGRLALGQGGHYIRRDGHQLGACRGHGIQQRLRRAGYLLRTDKNLAWPRTGAQRDFQQLDTLDQEASLLLPVFLLDQLACFDDAAVLTAGDCVEVVHG